MARRPKLTVYLDPPLMEILEEFAAQETRSPNSLAEHWLTQRIKKEREKLNPIKPHEPQLAQWATQYISKEAKITQTRLEALMSGSTPNEDEILAITRAMGSDFNEVKKILGFGNDN